VGDLSGKVAWVTGAGSGIGEAAAIALARESCTVALTGRRREPLEAVAEVIAKAGGKALVAPGDLGKQEAAGAIAMMIAKELGRLDILVNNAGANIVERNWARLTPERIKTVLDSNLNSAFYCAVAALNVMRPQRDGLLIHTASWAGRFVGLVPGPAYAAAKHGVVAMSYSINMEEFQNGIRSTVLCPAEVATPLLNLRPKPVPPEERARMIQPEDMASLIVYVAKQPATVCINEVVISPTWNRGYAHAAGLGPSRT
jgi:NAD(P)-dependent dehydrogenase (short-subunit alcohol dehydrogenase family)